ncbi:hypothetical protein DSO57_1025364 [Entomophthora muscae]|uniref:Uncharacterized protein n=1 Tax=Entomophthora muscae TaxID=34485 RepID=A0ACC2TD89_9FUNG|nr:hypothetical protein DSO57_1025364 [Entomophthora muscae]
MTPRDIRPFPTSSKRRRLLHPRPWDEHLSCTLARLSRGSKTPALIRLALLGVVDAAKGLQQKGRPGARAKSESYTSRPSSKHNKEKASFSHNKKSKQTAPSKSNYYKGDKEEALNFKPKPSRPREKSKLDLHCR